ncbi:TPA: hypothetical protein ACTC1I_002036, partial [Neisseria meningitidis]
MSNDALPFFAGGCFYIFFNSTDCILEDVFRYGAGKAFSVKGLSDRAVFYSGLTKTSTALPRLAVLFVLSAASSP